MRHPATSNSAWSIHRAFVVQFKTEPDAVADRIAGRVEHVASRETIRFQSWAELQTFIENLLGQDQTNPSGRS